MIDHLCYNYPCLGNTTSAFVAVWRSIQTCYNLLLTPLVKVAVFPRQEPPTLRGAFLFGDKMGTIKFIPSNEMGTREWFAANLDRFDYSIVKSQSGYPDYILEDSNGQKIRAEIEHTSDNFIWHGHDPNKCDLVVCWSHTLELSLPVLELSTGLLHEANSPATSPRQGIKKPKSSKKTFGQALMNCKGKVEIFILAFIKDFAAREMYLNLIENQRIELLKAGDNLVYALRDNGLNQEKIHPYDLFRLIVAERNQLDFGDLRFLKVANDSIDAIEEMLGESMRDLHT